MIPSRSSIAGLAVAASSALVLGLGSVPAAADSPACGFDIFVHSSGVTRDVTESPTSCEFNPDWSIDGERVVYERTENGTRALFETDLASGVTAPVPGAPPEANRPAYSPNGRWLAFDRFFAGDPTLYFLSTTGGLPTRIVADASDPDWSPDSHRLVFERPSDGSIRTVAPATGEETIVAPAGTIDCPGFQCGIAWSPNGRYIAYSGNGFDIWTIRVGVSGQPLSDPVPLSDGGSFFESQPAFTTDSRTILFTSDRGANGYHQLWSVPVEGGMPQVVWTDSRFSYDPAVARGGGMLAYAGSTS